MPDIEGGKFFTTTKLLSTPTAQTIRLTKQFLPETHGTLPRSIYSREREMMPSTTLLRTARVLFPSFRPTTHPTSRCFSSFTSTPSIMARRPTLLTGSREMQKGIAEQVRGMKVRSSVKKLCEGCKVRFLYFVSVSDGCWALRLDWIGLN